MADNPTTDLAERLTSSIAAAIEDVAPTFEHQPGRLQDVTIELALANGGDIVEAVVWTQRRAGAGRRP